MCWGCKRFPNWESLLYSSPPQVKVIPWMVHVLIGNDYCCYPPFQAYRLPQLVLICLSHMKIWSCEVHHFSSSWTMQWHLQFWYTEAWNLWQDCMEDSADWQSNTTSLHAGLDSLNGGNSSSGGRPPRHVSMWDKVSACIDGKFLSGKLEMQMNTASKPRA